MSEVWNNESKIEERSSIIRTPQINQLKQRFNIRDFDQVLKKLYNKRRIDDSDYFLIKQFLDYNHNNQFKERYQALIDNASDELKERYTIDKIRESNVTANIDGFIKDLYSGNLTYDIKEKAYNLIARDYSIMEDGLIDDRIKQILKENVDKEFIREEQQRIINSYGNNSLSGKELMNSEFKDEILNSIPSDYTQLEKSIYLYIKLCQTLSYDASYYVSKSENIAKHESFSNLKQITTQNPDAVCYEFVTLYSELLEKLGIKHLARTHFSLNVDENNQPIVDGFMDNHSSLDFTADNIIVSADSTISVLNGDLINAKLGNELNGLKCKNVNKEDREVFEKSLEKVYSGFEKNNNFKEYQNKIIEIPLTSRLRQLFNDITNINAQSVDFISYITNLKHKYFTPDELQWNVSINFVGKNDGTTKYPVVIFSINTNDILNVPEDTVQYVYDTKNHTLTKYENEELGNLFKTELFILDETKNIPGVFYRKSR